MSVFVKNGIQKHKSRLVKATQSLSKELDGYTIDPSSKGVFGSKAIIKCGDVKISSETLDVEFDVNFDDDMEANEASIVVYNLSDNTINRLTHHAKISIEAGFANDTGIVFKGFIDKVSTTISGADKVTTLRCLDDIEEKTITEITYSAGSTSRDILKDLLDKTGTPIAEFNCRRIYTYQDDQKVDGDLMENIKKYSDVCGVSTFVKNGQIYSRHIKEGEDISFTLSVDTGMIGSPSPYEEELTAEDFTDKINGYEVEMLLQHRISAGVIINLKSLFANGQFRVRSGSHRYNNGECVTKVKLMGECVTTVNASEEN